MSLGENFALFPRFEPGPVAMQPFIALRDDPGPGSVVGVKGNLDVEHEPQYSRPRQQSTHPRGPRSYVRVAAMLMVTSSLTVTGLVMDIIGI